MLIQRPTAQETHLIILTGIFTGSTMEIPLSFAFSIGGLYPLSMIDSGECLRQLAVASEPITSTL
ncbi:MAG: hypothetical protein NPIRA03_37700 [Nitrospirales bacterium]|nr:MAG: hypothetical protein NPIRA03_37700 [Nitrospirales bacterium]